MNLIYLLILVVFLDSNISKRQVVIVLNYHDKVLRNVIIFKYLVWHAIDEFGDVSQLYAPESSINAHVYKYSKECIKKRFILFIGKHYARANVIFWPDITTCHYVINVTDYLRVYQCWIYKEKWRSPKCTPSSRNRKILGSLQKRVTKSFLANLKV